MLHPPRTLQLTSSWLPQSLKSHLRKTNIQALQQEPWERKAAVPSSPLSTETARETLSDQALALKVQMDRKPRARGLTAYVPKKRYERIGLELTVMIDKLVES